MMKFAWAKLFVAVITVLVFAILVKLGLWQLNRAEEKSLWQAELSQRHQAAPLSYSRLLAMPKDSSLTGYRLEINATSVDTQLILLDNQVYNGAVGYLAYQVVSVSMSSPKLLVELGFVPGGGDRRILPDVRPLQTPQPLRGKLYQKSANPLSNQLLAEPGNPIRIQNLNLTELAQLINSPLAPAVLQPDEISGSDLPHPWQPIPLSAQKHQGYALQWFSMAAAFLILMGYLLIIKKKNKMSPH
ncbi:SURF1 family protein [Shewanella colwelliana]|nr:SURF1 family protein [Shewanella colwelliana]MDX1281439.1 SURF1 family protein [Shewanella colwelliana]OEG75631.1 hypothetical protein BEL05_17470 [Shewanella colwelliana]